ncbi:MAG: valyl-tRNA synthetase, partial [Solirubrobacteraceae bacterium]|nr:valyl-tRNA synthetase [Solirubrobacteraceae bacterium]
DPVAEEEMERAIEAIKALRAWRDSVAIKPGTKVRGVLQASGYAQTAGHVAALARFELNSHGAGEPVASVAIPGGAVSVLASDAVDLGAADRRMSQQREALCAEIERASGKLANEGFVAKAPQAVVDRERAKLERLREELAALPARSGGG